MLTANTVAAGLDWPVDLQHDLPFSFRPEARLARPAPARRRDSHCLSRFLRYLLAQVRDHAVYFYNIVRFRGHCQRRSLTRAPSHVCAGPPLTRRIFSHCSISFCCQRQRRPLTRAPLHICARPSLTCHLYSNLFRMINERLDEQDRGFKEKMKNRFETKDTQFELFKKAIKNTNHRLKELQLRMSQLRLGDIGIQEGKSGELHKIAKAGGRRITPPEPQQPQPLLPSQPLRLLRQPPMMSKSSMSQPPSPPSQPPPLQRYQSSLHQSRQLPSSMFSAGRYQLHSASSMVLSQITDRSQVLKLGALSPPESNLRVSYESCTSALLRKRSKYLMIVLALTMFKKELVKYQLPIPPSHTSN